MSKFQDDLSYLKAFLGLKQAEFDLKSVTNAKVVNWYWGPLLLRDEHWEEIKDVIRCMEGG